MLIKCPECELQVSDKALSCPHCGYVLRPNALPKTPRKSNKRKRLPNGFGQISEIKNRNLRNRFRAMVTVGKTSTGRPVCKPLKPQSFFPTYNDAYAALVEYNKNPYDLNPAVTMIELYERWSEEYFKTLSSESAIRVVRSTWAYCSSIYSVRVMDVRPRHIKICIDEGNITFRGGIRYPSAGIKTRMKSIFNLMLDYAVEYEMVDRNYARSFSMSNTITKEIETEKKDHIPFTDEEMTILWDNVGRVKYVDVVLIQCYSGWRPGELGLIKLEDVDLDAWTFTGGIKTDAGKNRIVPIHSKIRDLVMAKYKEAESLNSEYLFNCVDGRATKTGLMLTYDAYMRRFFKIRDLLHLNCEHRPHDGRMTFVTAAKKCGSDEYAIKYMIGHAIQDLTERVYTKRELDWLQEEIEKIQ